MTLRVPCPGCSCSLATPHSLATHAVLAALAMDDLDRALASGLLDCNVCVGCSEACNAQLVAARDARLCALTARERYRARTARLQQRVLERDARRVPTIPSTGAEKALPPAAAAALARAKARATERGSR